MDDHALVRIMDGRADGLEELQPLSDAPVAGSEKCSQRFALDEFHHQIGKSAIVGAPIDETGDVGMFEVGKDLPLRPEASNDLARIETGAQQLDSDGLVESAVMANGPIDAAHAARADEVLQTIGAERRDNIGRFVDEINRRTMPEGNGGGVSVGSDQAP